MTSRPHNPWSAAIALVAASLIILAGLAVFVHDLVVVAGATWLGAAGCGLVALGSALVMVVLDINRRIRRPGRPSGEQQ